MTRREFIGIAATGAVGLALPGPAGEAVGASWLATAPALPPLALLATPDVPGPLRHHEPVDRIGRSYRERFPAENNVDALADALLADLPVELGTADADRLNRELKELVQRDFAVERTVLVDGWVLSATEARQCALYSLLVHESR